MRFMHLPQLGIVDYHLNTQVLSRHPSSNPVQVQINPTSFIRPNFPTGFPQEPLIAEWPLHLLEGNFIK